ncbi:MAG: tRNA uracil 4-sulfurtransferase ThiI [Thermoplasmata archaeon]
MIVIRYDEIGLKGKNREYFERTLEDNIKNHLKRYGYEGIIERPHGRIVVRTNAPHNIFGKIFGIRSYSPAVESTLSLEDIYREIKGILEKKEFNSFRITAKRLWKGYEETSMEINKKIGEMVLRDFKKSVNLEKPDLNIGIEILNDRSYIFTEKYPGPGGIPYGIEGKIIMLISGGIDSPVASYLLMKRGADPTFLHFKTNDEILSKVRRLIEILETYSPKSLDLIVEDHGNLLKDIIYNLESIGERRWTCVFCKYSMLRRADSIAREIGALGIGTGESLGQVASQTLNNIAAENLATTLPVFRPLIGFDKIEIEEMARKIGTYGISISFHGCGCPFLPRHPITNASLERFKDLMERVMEKGNGEAWEIDYEKRC